MKTIHHVLELAAPREAVFAALTTGDGLLCWECVGGHEPWAQSVFRFEQQRVAPNGVQVRLSNRGCCRLAAVGGQQVASWPPNRGRCLK